MAGVSLRSRVRDFFVTVSILFLFTAARTNAQVTATWKTTPFNGNWNFSGRAGTNWSPSIPNGPSDEAVFGSSSITTISISANTEVAAIVFEKGPYTITASPGSTLTISGSGIPSGATGNFVTASSLISGGGLIRFLNSATAGSNTSFTNDPDSGVTEFVGTSTAGSATFTNNAVGFGGKTEFFNSASADNGIFINNGATFSAAFGNGGNTQFFDTTTAGSGTFTNNAGTVSGAPGGFTQFSNTATAGNGTFNNNAATGNGAGGFTQFKGSSTAGSGTFTNNGSLSTFGQGVTEFVDTSTAGSSTFTNNGGTVSGAAGGVTSFAASATAGNATFTNNGGTVSGAFGGETRFENTSNAGGATLIANGGTGTGGSIQFWDGSLGGTSTLQVFDNGNLDISAHNAGSITIGSLEGTGNAFLGANNLTVGSNNLSKTFTGAIQDGGISSNTGGSLTKTGTGTLSLSAANTYTGGTMVSAGALLVNNTTGSGTGSGSVTANSGGILAGTGTISGPVTINSGAALLGGKGSTPSGALTVANSLNLNSGSTIELVLGASGAHSTLTRTGGTWTFAAPQAFTFINGGAQPGVYDNIITGLAADPGTEGSWFITNPGFTGTFTYDGAGNIDLTVTAVHPQLSAAASQKLHGGAGTFPVNLPLNGTVGIECRSGGATGDYQLVVTFTNNVSVNGHPQAGVTSGQGQVGTGGVYNGGAVTVSGANVTVPLTNVTNAQAIAVTLFSVNDGANTGDVIIPMSVLIGDTTANGAVNSSDIAQTQSQSGQPVNSSNFREDVTVNGSINSSDIALVQSRSGTALPVGVSQSAANPTTTAPLHRDSPEKSF